MEGEEKDTKKCMQSLSFLQFLHLKNCQVPVFHTLDHSIHELDLLSIAHPHLVGDILLSLRQFYRVVQHLSNGLASENLVL